MAGHTVTPYEITVKRKGLHKETPNPDLLLGGMTWKKNKTPTPPVDLLDVVETNILKVEPVVSGDNTRRVETVAVARVADALVLVFACEIKGEREVIQDSEEEGRPVVLVKGPHHFATFYSCCMLWRPPAGTNGLLLIHSPWGRGGSKSQVMKLVQRACDAKDEFRVKLTADPMIPAKELARLVRRANATSITYTKDTGVRSEFDGTSGQQPARAELAVVVKGSDTIPFRNALSAALGKPASRETLFTIKVRNPATDELEEQTFDDVEVTIPTATGTKKYSIQKDRVPTMGYDFTSAINSVYWDLPEDETADWPQLLLDGTKDALQKLLGTVLGDI